MVIFFRVIMDKIRVFYVFVLNKLIVNTRSFNVLTTIDKMRRNFLQVRISILAQAIFDYTSTKVKSAVERIDMF
ncbi:hypothetical protein AYI69_g5670 [Smittium culicis]|uniref:Uncharacterized protein n=1 Tax=Smittium culicis TaxID=133412 RepID=A0A1R1Y4W8_9FUNG|nr:hypothetical protein AYI69_g5670 [Smittium culicis]